METSISSSVPTTSALPQPIITTSRLVIRALHPQDNHSMSLNANNPLISRYMSNTFPDPYTLSAADDWIAMNVAKSVQNDFGICEKSFPEAIIGGIGLKPGADVNAHTGEIGFWVGQNYWGNGYATEALEAFTQWAFLNEEVERTRKTKLYGGVFGGNTASMRCFDKCGYTREGILRGRLGSEGQ
ncbi:similar to GCN5-related N-acetyltransferase [Plenodomus lingam JN3]|uniref:Similar to GCN5-related N-acetyltransferase n=1 Tax=Leptosphaeria maculans (strain JN3 / isolate v23.1.3 / race Av1-4-5-6-7-8) TaxID=985895 RepID=E5A377_LEPMJ|nr:similar to GCN5-related N-acetyltransferase [Plenodomus lingam JN3]CBX98090.1 similar to GCN5-related N-acetyltransferase [Plenodomus lingam JN3]